HRRIGLANLSAAADPWRHVQRVAETASDRNPLQHVAVEDGAGRGRGPVHHRSRARDTHRLGERPNLKRQRQLHPLTESDIDVLTVERAEPLEFYGDLIRAWRQERRKE